LPSQSNVNSPQLADVEATLAKIEAHAESVEEIDIEDVDIEDPAYKSLLVGRKVKVLVQDVDLVRWKQDLTEDRNQMNDLEYRRTQLLKLQDAVIDLEDLSSGVSIADLTLTDFRIDLAQYLKAHPGKLESLPLGTFTVTSTPETGIPPGIVFCLRAEGEAATKSFEPGYPLAPHYLVHVGDDGTALLPFTQAKTALGRLKRVCVGRDLPDAEACDRFDKATKRGEDMAHARKLLSAAVAWRIGALACVRVPDLECGQARDSKNILRAPSKA
jgi:hypothetical protein